ncbi:hypothetical protein GIB67_031196 [Kingdonia uniflora]|uniref:Protein kinase domain-containing protein n=1 Tax=Kingdonia uniflora TaxID=39325 RepID=A0A7J7NKJ1_9MAGN|nr:hypothetical protein GIB67_031196 [Kingdonia uniflora]
MKYLNSEICALGFVALGVILLAPFTHGFTNQQDVYGMNMLYASLGYPSLPGWIPNGGDPCLEAWQGVTCVDSNITEIILNGANLGGQLGNYLNSFPSITTLDLSNNHIGGSIPVNLPPTLTNFFLSANQLMGSIPSSLSLLSQLTAMSLNDNLLTGELPDVFQNLTGLINLDLSTNNLSGQLPPSLENLSSLTNLRLQGNQLSGALDVLQDLPLQELNIENNLFSGPVPEKLLSITNFKKDGNLFNSTIAPISPPTSPPSSFFPRPSPPVPGVPTSEATPRSQTNEPASSDGPKDSNKFWTTSKVVWISIAGVLFLFVIVLGVVFFTRGCKERQEAKRTAKMHERNAYGVPRENLRGSDPSVQPYNQIGKVPKEAVVRLKDEHGMDIRATDAIKMPKEKHEMDIKRIAAIPNKEEHNIDVPEMDMIFLPPPPPPPLPPPLVEKLVITPVVPTEVAVGRPPAKILNPSSVRSFTIASLQQYTNSFSQENLIGAGMLGSVYRAELPDGKLLAIKKLDKAVSNRQKEYDFFDLVTSISKLRHANVVELVGFCSEHGQRLLVSEYCSNGTLYDALHLDDGLNKKLSWNSRVRIALGAARALEYLHEVCQPPIMHRNFKSANVLLDDELVVRVSDCGLAPLIASGSVIQLSGQLLSTYGYGAPEFETGTYTHQSDVYSFGVVMLELLTGRKSYDNSRPRGEQFLVRWAISQLHDIDTLSRMVDPSLGGEYPAKSLSRFADIISLCVQSEPEFRPPMSEIVQDLLGMIQRDTPNKRPSRGVI